MFAKTNLFCVLALSAFLFASIAAVENGCNKCLSNGVYCETDTTYYFCLNGEKLPSLPYNCSKDTICSNDTSICVSPSSTAVEWGNTIACKPTDPSNTCGAKNTRCSSEFLCLTPTRYGRCVNGQTMGVYKCEQGSLCSNELYRDQEGKSICAPQCVLDFMDYDTSCELYSLADQCWNAIEQGNNNSSFYLPNLADKTCQNFIECAHNGYNVTATPAQCGSVGQLFNPAVGYCESTYKCPTSKF